MRVYFVTIKAFGQVHTGRYEAETREAAIQNAKAHVGLTIKSSNALDGPADHGDWLDNDDDDFATEAKREADDGS